eukprot:UN05657
MLYMDSFAISIINKTRIIINRSSATIKRGGLDFRCCRLHMICTLTLGARIRYEAKMVVKTAMALSVIVFPRCH